MKIIFGDDNRIELRHIKQGEVFIWEDKAFIKGVPTGARDVWCTNLADGIAMQLDHSVQVFHKPNAVIFPNGHSQEVRP